MRKNRKAVAEIWKIYISVHRLHKKNVYNYNFFALIVFNYEVMCKQ
jgi:hypothetical protein